MSALLSAADGVRFGWRAGRGASSGHATAGPRGHRIKRDDDVHINSWEWLDLCRHVRCACDLIARIATLKHPNAAIWTGVFDIAYGS